MDINNNAIFSPPVRKASIQTDLVPLINIVFLLLIFFLVAGTAMNPEDSEFQKPLALMGHQIPEDALIIRLTNADIIEIDGRILTKNEVGNLANYLNNLFLNDAERQVLINADARIPAHYLTQMLNLVSSNGAKNIAIATQSN